MYRQRLLFLKQIETIESSPQLRASRLQMTRTAVLYCLIPNIRKIFVEYQYEAYK